MVQSASGIPVPSFLSALKKGLGRFNVEARTFKRSKFLFNNPCQTFLKAVLFKMNSILGNLLICFPFYEHLLYFYVCVYIQMCLGVPCGQKRMLDPLQLE